MTQISINDPAIAAALTRAALELGVPEQNVVELGVELVRHRNKLPPELVKRVDDFIASYRADNKSFVEWMREHRRNNPLPLPTGQFADKAFFDRMWGEPD